VNYEIETKYATVVKFSCSKPMIDYTSCLLFWFCAEVNMFVCEE